MGVKVARYVIAAGAACLVLGTAASAGVAAQPRGGSINSSAAAKACAGKRTQHASAASLTALTSCVLGAERMQLGLGYTRSASLSGMFNSTLGKFIGLSYVTDHKPQLERPAEQAAAQSMVKSYCRNTGSGVSHDTWVFAYRRVPPALTALDVARLLATNLTASGAISGEAGAVFGVAARPGLLFQHGSRNGVSLGMIAVVCD
jgi:hypothetical protein